MLWLGVLATRRQTSQRLWPSGTGDGETYDRGQRGRDLVEGKLDGVALGEAIYGQTRSATLAIRQFFEHCQSVSRQQSDDFVLFKSVEHLQDFILLRSRDRRLQTR